MKEKVLAIINTIRENKELAPLPTLDENASLRDDLCFNSFDLAELTVNLEDEFDIDIFADGLVNTVGEIYAKLSK